VTGFYRIGWLLLNPIFKYLFGFRARNPELVPAQGPVLICPNHRSFWDPPFVGSAITRPIHYLAKEELFTTFKPFGWLIKRLNAVPLKRDKGAVSAFRVGLSILETGSALLVFPEGTRNKTEATLLPLKDGAALLAFRSGAPLVPVYIYESRGKPWRWLLRLRRPEVRFGVPLDPRDYPEGVEGMKRITEDLKGRLLSLSERGEGG
jgi:1-acyl-sn-glycerol-3-phosphate acyltransferase